MRPAATSPPADNRLTWANHHLDQVQAKAGPGVARYLAAWWRVDEARTDLRHHDVAALLDRNTVGRIPDLEQRLDALDIWRRWANGDTLNLRRLGATVANLRSSDRQHAGHCAALGHAVQQWATGAGILLSPPEPPTRTVEPPGIELEL